MTSKGVIVEYDFAAIDGADLLFDTAQTFLRDLDGIEFDEKTEAKYFAGHDYLEGLTKLFAIVKTKKTAAKASRDLPAAFGKALGVAVAQPLTASFRNFVKTLTGKGVHVVIATRATAAQIANTFAPILTENVLLYNEQSSVYGGVKWDGWRRICAATQMKPSSVVAVTGSGFGVKAALQAGLAPLAVVKRHVAYQDFSGADDVVRELGAPAAKRILEILRID